jgi:hypothetical protein
MAQLNKWNVLRWWRIASAEAVAEHAAGLRVLPTQPMQLPRHAVEGLQSIFVRCTNEDVTTTDNGAIELALLPRDAVVYRGTAIIPGFNPRGKAGWLMFSPEGTLFYTRAQTVGKALDERARCEAHWAQVVASFGSEAHALARGNEGGAFGWCRLDDFESAGIGRWCARAALARRYVLWFARFAKGVPVFVVRTMGSSGQRVLAARAARLASQPTTQAANPPLAPSN